MSAEHPTEPVQWGSGGLVRMSAEPRTGAETFDTDAHLARVRRPGKRVVQSYSELAHNEVLTSTVFSRLHPARGIDQERPAFVPPSQIEMTFLLHLRDAYLGDNVVFDGARYFSFQRWWAGPDPGIYANTATIAHIDAGVLISGWGGNAFQHFILDAIPPLASVINLLEAPGFQHVKIVSHRRDAAFAQWFWRKLGLEERIVDKPANAEEGHIVHANHVLFPHFSPTLTVRSIYPRGCLGPLQQRMGLTSGGRRDALIYLSRTGLNRSVMDEEPLLAGLRALADRSGLELCIFSSERDWDADFALFSRAKLIVGPHGAGFANMVFAPPGAHIVEFTAISRAAFAPDRNRYIAYYGLAQAAGHHYWAIEPYYIDMDGPDMRVEQQHVLGLVQRILAETDETSGTPH